MFLFYFCVYDWSYCFNVLIPTTMFHEDIRVISKTTFFERATAACMLARRLQVYYGFYTPPLKLCDYVLFYYLRGVRPCHREYVVCHPEELSTLTSVAKPPNSWHQSLYLIKQNVEENQIHYRYQRISINAADHSIQTNRCFCFGIITIFLKINLRDNRIIIINIIGFQ